MKTKLLPLLFTAALVVFSMLPAAQASVEIGKPAPDFTLTDIEGKTHKLSDYRGKTVVLEWVNPECPFVIKHYSSGNIPGTQRAAIAEGVVWLSINSAHAGGEGDFDKGRVASWLKSTHAAPTAYFRDVDAKVGRLYAAKATPHLFVISKEGTLVYNGAIDSIRSADVADIGRATNYVKAALASVKAGKPVEKSATQPYGCSVKY